MVTRRRDVTCGDHGKVAGYIVCKHILAGASVDHLITPAESDDGVGEALCVIATDDHTVDDLLLICEHCFTREVAARRS